MTDAVIHPRLRFLRPHRHLSPPVALEAGPRRAGDGASGATPGSSGPERQRVPPSRGGPGSRGRLSHGQGPEPSGAPSGAPRGPAAPPGPERARCAGVAGHPGQSALARRPLPFRPLPRRAARPTCVYSAATAMGESARGLEGRDRARLGLRLRGRGAAERGRRLSSAGPSGRKVASDPQTFPGAGRPGGGGADWPLLAQSAEPSPRDWLGRGRGGAGATLLAVRVGEVGPPGGGRALLREPPRRERGPAGGKQARCGRSWPEFSPRKSQRVY